MNKCHDLMVRPRLDIRTVPTNAYISIYENTPKFKMSHIFEALYLEYHTRQISFEMGYDQSTSLMRAIEYIGKTMDTLNPKTVGNIMQTIITGDKLDEHLARSLDLDYIVAPCVNGRIPRGKLTPYPVGGKRTMLINLQGKYGRIVELVAYLVREYGLPYVGIHMLHAHTCSSHGAYVGYEGVNGEYDMKEDYILYKGACIIANKRKSYT